MKPIRKTAKKSLRVAKAEMPSQEGTDEALVKTAVVKNKYLIEVNRLKKTIPNWDDMFTTPTLEDRIDQQIRVGIIGQSLCEKYAWAIPDDRALNILKEFSPLIEIGCGLGYWAALLQHRGVDIVSFDQKSLVKSSRKQLWTNVQVGGAKKLSEAIADGRNLFLCYPDEGNSLAIKCLENFRGEYIIHVGELNGAGGGTLSSPQAPWGRTTSAEFQVALNEEFHCLLVAAIPRFPFSRDTISVWKRTTWVEGKPDDEEEDEEEDEEGETGAEAEAETGGDAEDKEDREDASDSGGEADTMWASIPADEQLPSDIAAPCLAHLLL